ncbi:MAG: hypothetical protein WCR45_01285 [Bacteroidaceae bacterium]|nr:hypothetical protein [Bacteroidaceae bacterium]
MSIHNADKFIKRAVVDEEFRKMCYSFKTKENLIKEMDFTPEEFDNVLNSLLFKCMTYDQADVLRQIQIWYSLFPHESRKGSAHKVV